LNGLNVLNGLNPRAFVSAWILRVLVSEPEHVEASFVFGLIIHSLIQAEPQATLSSGVKGVTLGKVSLANRIKSSGVTLIRESPTLD
jgi:hypothetical protein